MHAETPRSEESCQSHPIKLAEMPADTLSRLIDHIQVGWKRCYAIECHEFWQLESTGQEKQFKPNSPALEHGSVVITALHSECLLV